MRRQPPHRAMSATMGLQHHIVLRRVSAFSSAGLAVITGAETFISITSGLVSCGAAAYPSTPAGSARRYNRSASGHKTRYVIANAALPFREIKARQEHL